MPSGRNKIPQFHASAPRVERTEGMTIIGNGYESAQAVCGCGRLFNRPVLRHLTRADVEKAVLRDAGNCCGGRAVLLTPDSGVAA